jgi:hypothetical protein
LSLTLASLTKWLLTEIIVWRDWIVKNEHVDVIYVMSLSELCEVIELVTWEMEHLRFSEFVIVPVFWLTYSVNSLAQQRNDKIPRSNTSLDELQLVLRFYKLA